MRPILLAALLLCSAGGAQEVDDLVGDLRSKDERTRVGAAARLGRMGSRAESAAPALVRALGDESSWVAYTAEDALKKIGPGVVPDLVKGLKSRDGAVRRTCAELLDEAFAVLLAQHVKAVAAVLGDDDPVVRRHAAHALGVVGRPAIPELVRALGDRKDATRDAAVDALVGVGQPAAAELVDLVASKRRPAARAGAARALGRLREKSAANALFEAVSDKHGEVAAAAALALGRTGGRAGDGVPLLVGGLVHEDPQVRAGCIAGLAAYGEPAMPALVAALTKPETREAATQAVVQMGEPAMPGLEQALRHGTEAERRGCLHAVRSTPALAVSDGVCEALYFCLRHDVPAVRVEAAAAVAGLGRRALELAAPEKVKDDADPAARAAIHRALGDLGFDPGDAEDADPHVRVEALLARWKCRGGPGAATRDALLAVATGKDDVAVRARAVRALGDMGLAAAGVDLLPLLEDPAPEMRRETARALGEIVQPWADAVRAQRRDLKPDETVAKGLAWLAKTQREDGSWEAPGLFVPGVTGLAVLCFLGAGHGPGEGPHGPAIGRALDFMRKGQDPQGILSSKASHSFLEVHAPATMALAEAWMLAGDYRDRRAAQRAAEFIGWARNPGSAWRYEPRGGENDTNITAWMVTALKLADAGGLRVDREAYEGAASWIRSMTGAEGRTGYNFPGGVPARPEGKQESHPPEKSEAMTAAALWCRHLLGGDLVSDPLYKRGVELVLAKPPYWNAGSVDQFYWYYASQAMWQDSDASWKKWEQHLRKAMETGANEDGSWRMTCVWAEDGGPTYPVSMALLSLLAPNRYPRGFLDKARMDAADRAVWNALKKARDDADPSVAEAADAAAERIGR